MSYLEYIHAITYELVRKFEPKNILDVGCGQGKFVEILRENFGLQAFGIDISKQNILNAKSEIRGFLCQADAHRLPFKDCTFDLIIAHHSLEHFESPNLFIEEARRILKSGGVIFVLVPAIPFGSLKLWRMFRIQKDPDHVSMYTASQWKKIFKKYGFKFIGDTQNFVHLDPPTFWLGRMLLKLGPPGRFLWNKIAKIIRKSFIFRKEEMDCNSYKKS